MKTNILQLHPQDQVAIALTALPKGETVNGVAVQEPIPRWHKVALRSIAKESPVYKYGQIIGYATRRIAPGSWVHTHNLSMGRLFDLAVTESATDIPPDPPRLADRFFLGYRRPDGRAATRNYILLVSTVDCANHAVDMALRELNRDPELLARRYPNVDGIVGITHDSGCGLAANSEAHTRQLRTLAGFVEHPNAAARLVVGLGCEKGSPETLYEACRMFPLTKPKKKAYKKPFTLTIQQDGGTRETVDKIIAYVHKVLPEANRQRRSLIPASELILASQCGGSNALSGITANPAIGIASDLLIAAGGTAFFGETPETFGAGHLLTRRARTRAIAEKYLSRVEWWQAHLKARGAHFDNNPTPGNKEGGITTIAEKSLGAVAKSGQTALCGVVDYAETVTGPGLFFMDTPGYDPVSCTGQTAGGALVGVFSTGQGSCFGGLLVPWIKVVTNTPVYEALPDMEINAGEALEGTPLDMIGRRIFEQALAVASGARTYSEKMNIAVFNIWNTGVTT